MVEGRELAYMLKKRVEQARCSKCRAPFKKVALLGIMGGARSSGAVWHERVAGMAAVLGRARPAVLPSTACPTTVNNNPVKVTQCRNAKPRHCPVYWRRKCGSEHAAFCSHSVALSR